MPEYQNLADNKYIILIRKRNSLQKLKHLLVVVKCQMHPNSQIKIPFVAFSPQIDKNRNLKYFLPNKVIPIKKPKNQIKISYILYAYYSIAIYCIKIHFKKIEEYRPMRPCSHYKK